MTERDGIPSLIGAALRRTRAARALEAALLGASAAFATALACQLSGVEALRADALAVQALAALACAASWWVEHAPNAQAVAERADRELGCDGALMTAWESRGRGGALARLLAVRVNADLPVDAVARAARKPQLALVAPPLALAALCVAWPSTTSQLAPATLELVARTATALARAAASAPAGSELRAELERAAAALAQPSERSGAQAAALQRASAALERSALGGAGEGEPAQLAALDLARACEHELLAAGGATEGATEGATGGATGGSGSTSRASLGAGGMQNAPPLRTMSGSPQGSSASGTPTSPVPSHAGSAERAPERGTTAGRWWRPEEDAVVSAWRARAGQVPR